MKILSLLAFLCALLALSKAAAFPGPTDEVERDESLTEEPVFDSVTEEMYLKALNGTAHRSGSCSPGWTRLRGRCYHVFPILSTWFKAQKNCRSIGAHLASVHDFDMNYQLLKLITAAGQSRREVWIGGSDLHREGRWTWVDGTHFGYTNWCRWEPNNFFNNQHCLEMNYSRSKCWDDNNCYYEIPFICARNY
ncbi:PREDICTED: type-2 ice-structuring protein-like [Cyprinodon variegatus]|uniref:type-2 ice-structuring protein-like n=1 Tax=Cyprinodon variegatus TaxID=28743 RepID=UPI000742C570|nr:PREDICTED: type-2 ice-structuring protein-like [Cyprinodon variegatus]